VRSREPEIRRRRSQESGDRRKCKKGGRCSAPALLLLTPDS
jgi:hypothetical protein